MAKGEEKSADTSRGDRMLREYFAAQTKQIADRCLADIHGLDDWKAKQEVYRGQLFEMLGLDPLPEKTDLQPAVTGKVEQDEFTVEKLAFQSLPHLYVTANLYLPKKIEKPCPAILYLSGHGGVVKNGVSLGNKTHYQHHGEWFARHGYVCLTLDTLQLGEIQGLHHGTYKEGMWWWNNHGYTPAGVEAWNCIRALDYLQTRPEVDAERIGTTGRSGGGAYTWWIAALDTRIKVAVPVAGITDLQNYVVDGCVEGHCDCMFMVNTYRWDYPQVAALVAPRPLLIGNTDRDNIFPLDGVERLHRQVRDIYKLYRAEDKLGLQISEGPHKDTQELQIAAFHWFNRFLKHEEPIIATPAVPLLNADELRVFEQLPADQINTQIQESFVKLVDAPQLPRDADQWIAERKQWVAALHDKVFRGWPESDCPLDVRQVSVDESGDLRHEQFDFTSQEQVRLTLDATYDPKLVLASSAMWVQILVSDGLPAGDKVVQSPSPQAPVVVTIMPRGIGPTAWDRSVKQQTQQRRRFMLVGQTLEGMQVYDIRRGLAAVKSLPMLKDKPPRISLTASPALSGVTLFAMIDGPQMEQFTLPGLPTTLRHGPYFLNVDRFIDVPRVAALVAERTPLQLTEPREVDWAYPLAVAKALKWEANRFQVLPGQ